MPPSRAVVKKNRDTDDWVQVDQIRKIRKDQGKESEVYEWGEIVPQVKLRRATSRLRLSYVDQQRSKQVKCHVPLGFSILSPVSTDFRDRLPESLPFYDFEHLMREQVFWEARIPFPSTSSDTLTPAATFQHVEVGVPRVERVDEERGTVEARVEGIFGSRSQALEPYMPAMNGQDTWADHPYSQSSLDLYVSPLYRRILFSVSNNFVGMGSYSFEEVIEYLRKKTDINLYRLISSSSCYTSKAIMRNLFRGAIEAGDALVVRSILRDHSAYIDPNLEVCRISHWKWTPLERASSLRNLEIIKTLLEYPVDVNKSYTSQSPRGALCNAILTVKPRIDLLGDYMEYQRVDMEIFELLIGAGGQVHSDTLFRIIEARDEELFLKIVRVFASSKHRLWTRQGVFWAAFKELDITICKKLVTILVQVGADLDYASDRGYGAYPQTIIDIAARRGDLSLIQMLTSQGAKPTRDTLASAVSSGNIDMVTFLLQVCEIDSIGTLRITPLAAAISLKDPEMMTLLSEHGAWEHLTKKDQFESALAAAAEIGDIDLLQHLVGLGGEVNPDDLGKALMVIAKRGHNRAAYLLIDAGARLDFERYAFRDVPALQSALERHNEELVIKLLDAGANPNYDRTYDEGLNRRDPAIQLAVEWGNRAIIDRLIEEGADVNDCGWRSRRHALSIAIGNQDEIMCKVLLGAGADPNHRNIRGTRGTPLAVASRRGDLQMAGMLFDYGADPNDTFALTYAALLSSSDMLDLILARHRKVYAKPVKGFGSPLLKAAVFQGDEARVAMLLKRGMDPMAFLWEDAQGTSPFGFAISRPRPQRNNVVQSFLEMGCNPNGIVSTISSESFYDIRPPRVTALVAAVSTNDKSLVELLVKWGAKINLPARGGIKRAPIQRAAELGLHEMVEYLIRINADVNALPAPRGGGTALQLAAASGYIKTVQVLLNHKADVDATSSVNGRTALEAASEHGRLDTVQLLLNARKVQSRGLDGPQSERARQYAIQNGHFDVVDMLRDYEEQHRELFGHVEA